MWQFTLRQDKRKQNRPLPEIGIFDTDGNPIDFSPPGLPESVAYGPANLVSGYPTAANGDNSVAEGDGVSANGSNSHAEGYGTTAGGNGEAAHAEGYLTSVNARGAHAEGQRNTAQGVGSHAEGINALAQYSAQHVRGGRFIDNSVQGANQYSSRQIATTTTDATPKELTAYDPVEAAEISTWLDGQMVYAVRVMIAAAEKDGSLGKAWIITAAIRYNGGSGGNPVVLGSPTVTVLGGDSGASAWDVSLDVTGQKVRVLAHGAAGKTINWAASLQTQQVANY